MQDPEVWLREAMLKLGQDALLPSTEDSPNSAWVEDDRAPGGVAGYFERRRLPLKHRIIKDGRVFAFDFERDDITYRIRSGSAATSSANALKVVEVFQTILRWIDEGLVTWVEGFAGFAQESHEWWRVLRAPPDASRSEIESAYRRQARVLHPDVAETGNAEAFRRLHDAYRRALRSTAE